MKLFDKLFSGDATKKRMRKFEESIAAYDLAEQVWE